ncbi:SpvB/TcaC N-terminal domain-containing protein, partial [Xaviernesmea oryzae]|uniref:SpvB/TcaC N-terminal domain-containing protein n=1 Tax=Xaviernesmea oryzae TaxID=464029 RepID=UPI0008B3C474
MRLRVFRSFVVSCGVLMSVAAAVQVHDNMAFAADRGLGSAPGLGGGGGFSSHEGDQTAQPTSNTGQTGTGTKSQATSKGSSSENERAVDRANGSGTSSQNAESLDQTDSQPAKSNASSTGEKQGSVTTLSTTGEQPAAQSATTLAASAASSGDDLAPAISAIPKPPIPNISGNGFFSQSIDIDVPKFRGLEPKVTLDYNSARKTRLGGLYQGWLGYAWGLDGFDVIERASAGFGYPAFDSKDIYLLNGEELVPCSNGMVAASCSAGGTHVTEVENYKRISFNASANSWTVTDRDGTVSTFSSVSALAGTSPAAGTPDYDLQRNRWFLSSVSDTNGNKLTYTYTCADAPVCYPQRISYSNGMSVRFFMETRPDFVVMANGYSLSYTKQRVRTIATYVGTQLRSAYTLSYDQAPTSNTSRLTKVTLYGRDAAMASDGSITGGSAKVIRQMTYDNVSYNYNNRSFFDATRSQAGDLNFDGRDELFGIRYIPASDNQVEIWPWNIVSFNGDGSTRGNYHAPTGVKNPIEINPYVGRYISGSNLKDVVLLLRNSGGPYTPMVMQTTSDLKVRKLDCSGDYAAPCGKMGRSPDGKIVLDPEGDGYDALYDFSDSSKKLVGAIDLSANGMQSFLTAGVNSTSQLRRLVSGSWTTTQTAFSCMKKEAILCAVGDINGDGAGDVVSFVSGKADIFLSTGRGFQRVVNDATIDASPLLRDLDNDGKFDLLANGFGAMRSWSIRFDQNGASLKLSDFSREAVGVSGDFNGDGLPDFVKNQNEVSISQAGAGNPNLLRTVTLETGGVVSIDYTPSTQFTNTFLPQVLHAVSQIRVDDGRGQV